MFTEEELEFYAEQYRMLQSMTFEQFLNAAKSKRVVIRSKELDAKIASWLNDLEHIDKEVAAWQQTAFTA